MLAACCQLPTALSPAGCIDYHCRENGRVGDGDHSDFLADEDTDQRDKQERAIRCRRCGAHVTSVQHRCVRSGQHLHTFFNPAGILFEIGCFRQAPGCLVHGAGSTEFTWFAGYSWRIVYCGSCLTHLGWYFSCEGDGFFGLVISRLQDT